MGNQTSRAASDLTGQNPVIEAASRIALLADGARSDASALAGQALRLREAATTMPGPRPAVSWPQETVRFLVERIMVAADDLDQAAKRLDQHAADLLSQVTLVPAQAR